MLLERYPFYYILQKSHRHIFWREVKPNEVKEMVDICIKINYENNGTNSKMHFKELLWENVLSTRFSGSAEESKNSYLLNYTLFFDHLLLWNNYGRPKRNLYWLYYANDFDEFKEKLKFLILTTGRLLEIINIVLYMQNNIKESFNSKDDWLEFSVDFLKEKRFLKDSKRSMLKDELSRYFPGIFNTFEINILKNMKFNKNSGYDIDVKKLDIIMIKGLFSKTDIFDDFMYMRKMGFI